MPLIVPNAGDTTGGNKYEALDQAEPDSLDFEMLSLSGSGVVSGCAVTSISSSTAVAVAAGVIVVNGLPYAVSANASLSLPAAPADNRFDLIVARVTSGSASLVVVQGDNSSTNPAFPKSASVITGSPSLTTNVNFDTDVVLAAVYRSGASTVTSSRIVDKRIPRLSALVDQGTSAPATSYGAGTGALFFNKTAPTGTASGVYVKLADATWIELAQNVGPHLPIGAAVVWPSKEAVPTGCIEANGQALSTSTYPDLFAVYGYTHGGSGGTFNVPDYNNKFIRGTTTTSIVGTSVGADSVTLSEANLPSHVHTMAHTHTYAHTHGYTHTHSGTSDSGGSHSHSHYSAGGWSGFVMVKYSSSYFGTLQVAESTTSGRYVMAVPGPTPDNQFGPTTITGTASAHTHTFTTSSQSSSTTNSQDTTTTSASSASNTGSVGSGTAVSTIPGSQYARWIIRATYGVGSPYSGSSTGLIVQEGDVTVINGATTLDFGTGFDVSESPSGEANITFDPSEVSFGQIKSSVVTVAASGATETLDASTSAVFDVTMDQNCVFTFSGAAAAGTATIFTLILRGAFTPTFPASVDWGDATPPTYGSPSVYTFMTVDGGTTWMGAQVGKSFA